MTEAAIPGLQLAGYFPKKTAVPERWAAAFPTVKVAELCSVSHCLARAPEDWVGHWLHNDWGFYNTPEDARAIISPSEPGFTIFAYRVLPFCFAKGAAKPLPNVELHVEPLPANYRTIGFDVVSRSISAFFECSPLSCNGLAADSPVNTRCLVDELENAKELARRFSWEEPEPGPYFVLEVLRPLAE